MSVLTPLRFYLGAHHSHWLRLAGVPLFVSRRELAKRKTLPRAIAPWALDSGGFTELKDYGHWTVDARTYAAEVRRFRDEIGMLDFAAAQDWMTEPDIINGKWHPDPRRRFVGTKLSVREHQRRTIANYLELLSIAPDLPWMPVIQGWTFGDYLHHVDDYAAAGVDLTALPRVGVGSVCKRQHTAMVGALMTVLARDGIRLHAFGFKLQGLSSVAGHLASADSLAWSYQARRNPPLPGHEARHKNCANCLPYAIDWLEGAHAAIERGQGHFMQLSLPTVGGHIG